MTEILVSILVGAVIALVSAVIGWRMGRVSSGNAEQLFDNPNPRGRGRVLDAFPFPRDDQQGAEAPESPEIWETS